MRDPRWLLHEVRSPIFLEQVKSKIEGATVRGIDIRDLKCLDVVLPPIEEQAQIVDYLESALKDVLAPLVEHGARSTLSTNTASA